MEDMIFKENVSRKLLFRFNQIQTKKICENPIPRCISVDAAVEDHGYSGYTNSFDNYDTKPVAHESYGPPKSQIQYLEPHAIYGTPEFNGEKCR